MTDAVLFLPSDKYRQAVWFVWKIHPPPVQKLVALKQIRLHPIKHLVGQVCILPVPLKIQIHLLFRVPTLGLLQLQFNLQCFDLAPPFSAHIMMLINMFPMYLSFSPLPCHCHCTMMNCLTHYSCSIVTLLDWCYVIWSALFFFCERGKLCLNSSSVLIQMF